MRTKRLGMTRTRWQIAFAHLRCLVVMNITPIIETERLLLREPILEDWPNFAELMTSDRARYMGGPFSISSAWGVFCQGIALWQLFGVGNLSIELRGYQLIFRQTVAKDLHMVKNS